MRLLAFVLPVVALAGAAAFVLRPAPEITPIEPPKAESFGADLVGRGVFLEEGSAMSYAFTGLNAIKPEMVAEATKDARASAEQFADDSGASVGAIKDATQGYFTIEARDGDSGGWGVSDTPYKKVRVVTTVNFSLD